jgi:hypothetical protein
MGYCSFLEDIEITNAKVKNPQEFLKKVEEQCTFGFAPDNAEIVIEEDGKIKDIEIMERDYKWYDDEDFVNILASHLEDGFVTMEFAGEDGANWSFTIAPDLILENDWKNLEAEALIDTLNSSKAPTHIKEQILTEFKTYWEEQLNKANKNLSKLKELTSKKVYCKDEVKIEEGVIDEN